MGNYMVVEIRWVLFIKMFFFFHMDGIDRIMWLIMRNCEEECEIMEEEREITFEKDNRWLAWLIG